MAALMALSPGARADEPSAAGRERAQQAFSQGNALFDSHRYAEAADKFRESYESAPSPNSRFMLGRALLEAGRLDEAYMELRGTIADAGDEPRYAQTAKAARAYLEEIAPRVGLLLISVRGGSPDTRVHVAGRSYRASSLDQAVAVSPGTTTLVVGVPGGGEVRREVTVAAGDSAVVELDLDAPAGAHPAEPPPGAASGPPPGSPTPQPGSSISPAADSAAHPTTAGEGVPLRTWSYVAGGAGAAGLGAFAIFGSLSNAKFKNLQAECSGPCPERQDEIAAGRRQQTLANIGLAVGVTGLAAGAVLFVLSGDDAGDSAAGAGSSEVVAGPGRVGIRGRF